MKFILLAVGLLVVFTFILFLTKLYNSRRTSVSLYMQSQLQKQLKKGYQQAVLSEQDKNPIIALIHASSALNYLESVEGLVSPAWVQRHLKNNITYYKNTLLSRISKLIARISKLYPKIAVKSKYSNSAGWMLS